MACGFVLLISAIEHYGRRWIVPPVCWVLLAGLAYGLIGRWAPPGLPPLHLSPEAIFYLFLPVLLFSSARQLKLGDLRAIGPQAGTLATIGVLLSAGILGAGAKWLLALSWPEALLLAVALAATDPLAIGAMVDRFRIPHRLRTLTEGESMLNDGTSVVLFAIIAAIVFERTVFVAERPVVGFLLVVLGGAVIGVMMGFAGSLLIGHWRALHDRFIGTLIPLVTIYLTFLLAEALLHVSGVIAVLAATLTLTTLHERQDHQHPDSASSHRFFDRFWEFTTMLINAVLFFALGAMIGGHPWDLGWLVVPALIVLMLLARSAAVYGSAALLSLTPWRLTMPWQHLLNIAGLKGALSVALLMMLPQDYEHRLLFICVAFALVLFTFVANPITAQWYLRHHPIEDRPVES